MAVLFLAKAVDVRNKKILNPNIEIRNKEETLNIEHPTSNVECGVACGDEIFIDRSITVAALITFFILFEFIFFLL